MSNFTSAVKNLNQLAGAFSSGTAAAKNIQSMRVAPSVVAGIKGMVQNAGALALVTGGVGAVGMIADRVKLNSSYQKMLQLYPELQRESPERVKLYFDSISNSSPSVAQQPLVAGSLIKRLINYDGFDHAVYKDLVSAQSQLDRNRLSSHSNLIDLAGTGLNTMHTYRFGR